MSSVSKLKDKARDFERKEDWDKAVGAYLQVIQATEKDNSEAELSLYNRVGDLYLRLGRPSDAVDYYSKAAHRYGEAGLYNNAIALCNKALRYQPDRLDLYRKLGKLSAEQGFITDARRWYLEYAERLAKQGKTQEAFDALKEFAGLSEDPEIREMLAAQLEPRGETAEVVTQLRLAWTQYKLQSVSAKVAELGKRIVALDPRLEGTDLTLTSDGSAGQSDELHDMYIDRAGAAPGAATSAAAVAAPDATPEAAPLPGLMSTDMGVGAGEEVAASDLPTLDVEKGASLVDADEDDDEGDEAAFELPTITDEAEYGAAEVDEAEPLAGLEGFGEVEPEVEEDEEPEEEDELGGDLPMLAGELTTADEAEAETDEDEEYAPLPTFESEEAEAEEPEEDVEEPLAVVEEAPEAEAEEPEAVAAEEPEPVDEEPVAVAEEEEEEVAAALEEEEPEEEEPEEEEPEEDEETLGEIGAALDQVMIDEPSAGEDLEPFTAEEEAVAAPIVGEILDVDALIRGARERFEAGEQREALATLDAQHANLADANRLADAYRVAEALVGMDRDAVSAHQSRVEYAFRLDDRGRLVDAYLDFAAALGRTGAEAKSASVLQRVLEIDPQNAAARAALARPSAPSAPAAAPADSEFVDLGGLMMDEEEQQTTRFVVAETVESGDEERDFADMLSQFRAKVAQHVPQEDTESHYDLGIAFKEMGLIDEAISEFQIALRGGNERLKVYEELGQCFMQKEQYNIAAKLLARGAQLPASDDAELLGVYYLLGRCFEELGQTAEAREAYERVLGLDIDFRDVNERLSRL